MEFGPVRFVMSNCAATPGFVTSYEIKPTGTNDANADVTENTDRAKTVDKDDVRDK